jgi:8-amino-7-oxononanoate synthase
VARVTARQSSRPSLRVEELRPRSQNPALDFTSLPGYREIQQLRAMSELVGLQLPFFRVHEARAGTETQIGGQTYLNFASYDYLGFNGHPEVMKAAQDAVDRYGVSAGASRLVAGERPLHRELEKAIADIYRTDDCLVMVSGHATNVSTIGHLVGPKDLVIHDVLAHNSIVMGAKLSGAERRSFLHNDLGTLDALLASTRHSYERVLIVVEGLYSMDGDFPHLPTLLEIKRRHGAWLMVDEAHALGVLGERGYGIADHFGVDPRGVDIWMGTLSKTLAACGGYIAGSAPLIDYLKCIAGGFVYSVGISPPVTAAALASVNLLKREPERVARLHRNGERFVELARAKGLDVGEATGRAVVPVMVGDSLRAMQLAHTLFEHGINVLPIIHPAVPERSARLRFFVTSEHTPEQIDFVVTTVAEQLAMLPSSASRLAAAARS